MWAVSFDGSTVAAMVRNASWDPSGSMETMDFANQIYPRRFPCRLHQTSPQIPVENPPLFPSCSREAPHGRRRRWWSMVPRRATKPWRCRLSTPASPVDQSGNICGGWRFINSCFIYSHIFPCTSVYIYIYSTPQNPPKIICQCYFHYLFLHLRDCNFMVHKGGVGTI